MEEGEKKKEAKRKVKNEICWIVKRKERIYKKERKRERERVIERKRKREKERELKREKEKAGREKMMREEDYSLKSVGI